MKIETVENIIKKRQRFPRGCGNFILYGLSEKRAAVTARERMLAPMEVDLEEFRPYFCEYDLDQAQKDELIRTLWNIMCAFVDLGWGVDSIHFSLPELTDFSTSEASDGVHSGPRITIKEDVRAAFTDPPRLED